MSGTTPLDSVAAFKGRAAEYGLDTVVIDAIAARGVDTLSKAAYAICAPGTQPSEDALKRFLDPASPDAVGQGQLAIGRRLIFEAQTLRVSRLKMQLDGTEEIKQDLQPEKRRFREQQQKAQLRGMNLVGPLECAHACYTIIVRMQAEDQIVYLPPSKFCTREREVQQSKPPREKLGALLRLHWCATCRTPCHLRKP